jgi:hypothetical protein
MRGRRVPSVDFSRPISPRLQARVSDFLYPTVRWTARPSGNRQSPASVVAPAPRRRSLGTVLTYFGSSSGKAARNQDHFC